jgi:hypothetical protein
MININHFKSILKENFKSINVIKLCTNYEKTLTRFKYIKMSNTLKMKTYEDDAEKSDVKKITYLMRCFLIYIQIILIFIDSTSRERLNSAFMFYVNKFLSFSIIYIWESVRSWHFIIHAFRIAQKMQNLTLWETSNRIIENCILIKREKQSQALKSFDATSRLLLQTCNWYNVEFECYLNCRYRHACLICEIENHLALQCSIERE